MRKKFSRWIQSIDLCESIFHEYLVLTADLFEHFTKTPILVINPNEDTDSENSPPAPHDRSTSLYWITIPYKEDFSCASNLLYVIVY